MAMQQIIRGHPHQNDPACPATMKPTICLISNGTSKQNLNTKQNDSWRDQTCGGRIANIGMKPIKYSGKLT